MRSITDTILVPNFGYIDVDRSISRLIHDINVNNIISYNCCSGMDCDHIKNKRENKIRLSDGYLMLAYNDNLFNYICGTLDNSDIVIELHLKTPSVYYSWDNNITIRIKKDTDSNMSKNWNIVYRYLMNYNANINYSKPIMMAKCNEIRHIDKSIKHIVNNLVNLGISVIQAVSGLSSEYETYQSGFRSCGNDGFLIIQYNEDLWNYIISNIHNTYMSASLNLNINFSNTLYCNGSIRFSIPLTSDTEIMHNWYTLYNMLESFG